MRKTHPTAYLVRYETVSLTIRSATEPILSFTAACYVRFKGGYPDFWLAQYPAHFIDKETAPFPPLFKRLN